MSQKYTQHHCILRTSNCKKNLVINQYSNKLTNYLSYNILKRPKMAICVNVCSDLDVWNLSNAVLLQNSIFLITVFWSIKTAYSRSFRKPNIGYGVMNIILWNCCTHQNFSFSLSSYKIEDMKHLHICLYSLSSSVKRKCMMSYTLQLLKCSIT